MQTTAKSNSIFQRVEKKYLLSQEQYEEVRKAMTPFMQVDEYGLDTICNIYYDTEQFDLIRNSIEKPAYKEKLRVRSYRTPSEEDMVYVELKKKWKGIVYKRRISMTHREADDYLVRGIRPKKESQILREIDYFLEFYKPVPKFYIAYDRIAMFGIEDSSIRITFDQDIRSRQNELELTKGDAGELLMEENQVLMEIKVPGAYPQWLVDILSENKIYPTSFSKYGRIYSNMILEQIKEQKKIEPAENRVEEKGVERVCLPA